MPQKIFSKNQHEKASTLKIDELFVKTRRINKYSSMKINTIRDDDHTREEELQNLNHNWYNNYNVNNI